MKKPKIAFIGQEEYFRFHYESDLAESYEVFSYQLRYGAGADYYARLIDFAADINVFFRGELVPAEVISRLTGRRISISTEPFPKLRSNKFEYTLDSLGRFRAFLDIAQRDFDIILHYDDVSREFLESQGLNLSGFLTLPIATGTYRLIEKPRTRDVLFVGRSTPHRERFLGAIKRDFDCLHIAHGLPTSQLPDLSASFKVALNLHAEDELSLEPRVPLALACGNLLMSEPVSPSPLFIPNEHFVQVATPEEAYSLCQTIVADPGQFERIRAAGQAQVHTNLPARRVFPKLFEDILGGRYPRPIFETARLRLGSLEICKKHKGFEHLLEGLTDFHA